jgi:hypothetical protein
MSLFKEYLPKKVARIEEPQHTLVRAKPKTLQPLFDLGNTENVSVTTDLDTLSLKFNVK